MINSQMRDFNYYVYGTLDAYGQPTLGSVAGTIKMSINLASHYATESPLYQGVEYVGLTHDAINDSYVIDYEGGKLKALFINSNGRYKQVFLAKME